MNGTHPVTIIADETSALTSEYPESAKLSEVAPYSNRCGEFIDWLAAEKDLHLGTYDAEARAYYQRSESVQDLLAEFFEIDMNKVEQERRTMLEKLREVNQ